MKGNKSVNWLGVGLAVTLIFAGCQLPVGTSAKGAAGSVTLTLLNDARTILPSASDRGIVSYEVSGVGPSGATVGPITETNSSFTLSSLQAGSWTFTVDGLNADGVIVARGTSAATTIAVGSTAGVNIKLKPKTGTGTFALDAKWNSSRPIASLSGTLTPVGTTTPSNFAATVDVAGMKATYLDATLAAGSYLVLLTAIDEDGQVAHATEALQVYDTLTSTWTLTDQDFSKWYWQSAAATTSISPAGVSNGTLNSPISFTFTASGVSAYQTITFSWNFGDGSADSSGTQDVTVTSGEATYTLSHTYTSTGSYGLVVVTTASDGTNDITLNTTTEAISIGQATVERPEDLSTSGTWTAAGSGGEGITLDSWDISVVPAGTAIDLRFDAYSIPDRFIVEYPVGTVIYDSGWWGDSYYNGSPTYPGGVQSNTDGINDAGYHEELGLFIKNTDDTFQVTIIGGESGTAWDYSVRATW